MRDATGEGDEIQHTMCEMVMVLVEWVVKITVGNEKRPTLALRDFSLCGKCCSGVALCTRSSAHTQLSILVCPRVCLFVLQSFRQRRPGGSGSGTKG